MPGTEDAGAPGPLSFSLSPSCQFLGSPLLSFRLHSSDRQTGAQTQHVRKGSQDSLAVTASELSRDTFYCSARVSATTGAVRVPSESQVHCSEGGLLRSGSQGGHGTEREEPQGRGWVLNAESAQGGSRSRRSSESARVSFHRSEGPSFRVIRVPSVSVHLSV